MFFALGLCTILFVVLFYRPLQYITFDEVSAKVAGLPVERLNLLLALLTALTVSLSMRIVGLLLVSAMMVIPVACALQTARSFCWYYCTKYVIRIVLCYCRLNSFILC